MMQETVDLKNKKIICTKCYNELKPDAYDKNIYTCVNCNANVFLNVEDDKEKYLIINKKNSSENKVQNNTEDNTINEEEIRSVQLKKEKRKEQIIGILKEIGLDILMLAIMITLPLIVSITLFITVHEHYESTTIFDIIFTISNLIVFSPLIIVHLKYCIKRQWDYCYCSSE